MKAKTIYDTKKTYVIKRTNSLMNVTVDFLTIRLLLLTHGANTTANARMAKPHRERQLPKNIGM